MDFGINLATSADSWKIVKRAEELGYTRAWFYDTQLLNAGMFVAMGATAVQASRIRLATGVLIPSNRIAPVAAAGYNHFAISIRHGHPDMLEDWADVFAGL
ncbi:MAG: LLM class flavin-dependent oxidoreductase [Candidatus Rokuibacteriota bacterium]